jgi:hypothetical protein
MFLCCRALPLHRADNLSADCLDNVGSSASHSPIGLHGLLRGECDGEGVLQDPQ